MADQKVENMTENTSPAKEDLLYTVADPSGTPVDRRVTVANVNMGLVLLEELTVSSEASIDMENWYSSNYDIYQIELINIIPDNNTVRLCMRMSTNGGSSYDNGANYGTAVLYARDEATSDSLGQNSGASEILITTAILNTTAYGGVTGTMTLYSPGSSTYYKSINFHVGTVHSTSNYLYNMLGTARYYVTTAVNAFQLYMGTGDISGTVRVYGLRRTVTTTTTTTTV